MFYLFLILNIYLFLSVHLYFNWQGSIEYHSRCGNAVNETPPDEFLKCSLEDFHECFQRALEEKDELIAEVKYLKTELKESKAETEELRKTVNDMKQVSCSYTVLTPWLLFLCPLLLYAVVFWLAVMLHIWEANSLNLALETEHLDCGTCILWCSSLLLENSILASKGEGCFQTQHSQSVSHVSYTLQFVHCH